MYVSICGKSVVLLVVVVVDDDDVIAYKDEISALMVKPGVRLFVYIWFVTLYCLVRTTICISMLSV